MALRSDAEFAQVASQVTDQDVVPGYKRTYNKEPAPEVGKTEVKYKSTKFDAVLLRNIKVTQAPSFFMQHLNRSGIIRFQNAVDRYFGCFTQNTKFPRGLRWVTTFMVLLSLPHYAAYFKKRKDDYEMVKGMRYGEKFDDFTPYEKKYYQYALTKAVNEPKL